MELKLEFPVWGGHKGGGVAMPCLLFSRSNPKPPSHREQDWIVVTIYVGILHCFLPHYSPFETLPQPEYNRNEFSCRI